MGGSGRPCCRRFRQRCSCFVKSASQSSRPLKPTGCAKLIDCVFMSMTIGPEPFIPELTPGGIQRSYFLVVKCCVAAPAELRIMRPNASFGIVVRIVQLLIYCPCLFFPAIHIPANTNSTRSPNLPDPLLRRTYLEELVQFILPVHSRFFLGIAGANRSRSPAPEHLVT